MSSAVPTLVATIVLLVVSCAGTREGATGSSYPPRPDGWVVDVYFGPEVPEGLFEAVPAARPASEIPENASRIARISGADAPASTSAALVAWAQLRASKLGGDGIVFGRRRGVREGAGERRRLKEMSISVLRYRP